jgi:hypothetical protein
MWNGLYIAIWMKYSLQRMWKWVWNFGPVHFYRIQFSSKVPIKKNAASDWLAIMIGPSGNICIVSHLTRSNFFRFKGRAGETINTLILDIRRTVRGPRPQFGGEECWYIARNLWLVSMFTHTPTIYCQIGHEENEFFVIPIWWSFYPSVFLKQLVI